MLVRAKEGARFETIIVTLAEESNMAAEDAYVTLNGRTPARVNAAMNRLREELATATVDGIAADLCNADGCRTLIDHLPDVDLRGRARG